MSDITSGAALPAMADGLQAALQAIEQGYLWLDGDLTVRGYNPAYRKLLGLAGAGEFIGRPYVDILGFLLDSGEIEVDGEREAFVAARLRSMQRREERRFDRVRPNGMVLSITAVPLQSGGYIYTYLDVTRETRAREQLQRNAKAMVVAMANFSEHRDLDTGIHILRVARLVGQTARKLQRRGHFLDVIDEAYIDHVATASMLHDVGKISTPDRILLKPGPLTESERDHIKLHATSGSQILRQASRTLVASQYLDVGAEIALTHHEHFDGSGYPQGLAGDDIPLGGRICAIADVFDALTSRRPYKAPWSVGRAAAQIRKQAGRQFDPVMVDAFLDVLRDREQVSLVHWTPAMSVGNLHLDEQHMILIDTINQLASAQAQNDRVLIGMIIDELVNYTVFHFDYEERLIEAAGAPDFERHQRVHRGFVKWVEDLREEFTYHRRRRVDERILGFLRDWLSEHILGDDRAYRPYIAGLN